MQRGKGDKQLREGDREREKEREREREQAVDVPFGFAAAKRDDDALPTPVTSLVTRYNYWEGGAKQMSQVFCDLSW
jgi:hypothetical protein